MSKDNLKSRPLSEQDLGLSNQAGSQNNNSGASIPPRQVQSQAPNNQNKTNKKLFI